jgi:hypothetical protein
MSRQPRSIYRAQPESTLEIKKASLKWAGFLQVN